MKNARRTIGVLILVVASMMLVSAVKAQKDAAPEKGPESISGDFSASCLLKVVTDPSVLSLGDETINYLMHSSSVWDRAVEKVLGATMRELNMASEQNTFIVVKMLENVETAGPPSEHRVLLSLAVNLPDWTKPMAKEVMEDVVANFRKAVESACKSEVGRLDDQIRLSDREVHEADAQLRDVQQRLLDLSDRDLSSEALRSSITVITSQLQGLQLEKVSQEAYRQGILKHISEIRAEVERTVHQDAIAAELEQIVQRRTAEMKDVKAKVDTGLVAVAGLAEMEDKLAMARIELARRREELGRTGSAAGLGQLTAELTTLALEGERMRAKEDQLNRQLVETRDLLSRAGDYERMMLRLDVARQNLREAETMYNKTTQRVRTLQVPSVSVIGG